MLSVSHKNNMTTSITKGIAFIDRNPTENEVQVFRLAMSTFQDGSGQEREKDDSTRPGWRDFERIFAELLNGRGSENKEIFDVIVKSNSVTNEDYGLSIKSKQLSRITAISDLEDHGRVYMEVANSPAKFWAALSVEHITEQDFRNQRKPQEIGNTIISVLHTWHEEAAKKHNSSNIGRSLNLRKSAYITVSYSEKRKDIPRQFQIHSFSMEYPKNIKWKYLSSRCLRGYDPENPEEVLIDWYALSGGQLKYYPKANKAKYKSIQFSLAIPPRLQILDKVKDYWPADWKKLQNS